MENLLSGYYATGESLHAIISPYDGITYGIITALEAAGFEPGTPEWPFISGGDAQILALKNMIAGKQAFSNWRDSRVEASHALDLVEAVLKGTEPEINNTPDFDNGVKVVPTYVVEAAIITVDNYEELLIDSGFYKKEELE